MLLFAISAYLTVCMSYYKVGKLFAAYAFLSGLSVSLAPCSQLHPAVDITETISALAGSLTLFQTIGQYPGCGGNAPANGCADYNRDCIPVFASL